VIGVFYPCYKACYGNLLMSWWILFIIGWILAAFHVASGILLVWFLRNKRIERCANSLFEPERWPLVSVVVAARDESQHVEQTLRSLAGMDYPAFEVIAINDRSRDDTGKIMDRAAEGNSKIRVIHISELPEGWLGKSHALHLGAQRAAGELLLFTDGDVSFDSEVLRMAIRYFNTHSLDHLTLIPGFPRRAYWEDALKTLFVIFVSLGTGIWGVSTKSKYFYIGVGAFNLVRRSAYDGIGGHESIKMEILDDVMLGKRIKQEGYRQDALHAPRHLRLTWLEGVGGFIKGLEKNAFAALKFSLSFLLILSVFLISVITIPCLGVIAFQDARISGYLVAFIAMHASYGYQASNCGNGWRLVPALPVAALIYLWTFWRSAFVTLRQRGIRWRDTFYSIDDLKRGSSAK
jgi:glycosyltransferase involved in cell wall biosynthesis